MGSLSQEANSGTLNNLSYRLAPPSAVSFRTTVDRQDRSRYLACALQDRLRSLLQRTFLILTLALCISYSRLFLDTVLDPLIAKDSARCNGAAQYSNTNLAHNALLPHPRRHVGFLIVLPRRYDGPDNHTLLHLNISLSSDILTPPIRYTLFLNRSSPSAVSRDVAPSLGSGTSFIVSKSFHERLPLHNVNLR